jgi:hypothetical protein
MNCATCQGPLVAVDTGPLFGKPSGLPYETVLVHARHRDWAEAPHPAEVAVTRRRARAA